MTTHAEWTSARRDGWLPAEITTLTGAAEAAPSVHDTHPWQLEFAGDTVWMWERLDRELPVHDPAGRDRRISCGAALANLQLAANALGWTGTVHLYPDPSRPARIAALRRTGRAEPSDSEIARYTAIPSRHSHRRPFAGPAPVETERDVVAAAFQGSVSARQVKGLVECAVLADLLVHAALVLRVDGGYQRELAAWTARSTKLTAESWRDLLPAAGLVRADTRVPNADTLAARLHRESLLVIETVEDSHRDQVRAGIGLQRAWLAATAAGLAGSVLTQPLQLREVRAGLAERLALRGYPQAIMRFGRLSD